MADDDLSRSTSRSKVREELGWGGPRQKKWHTVGKRAIIQVEPQAHEVVTLMARLCTRTILDMNAQIYALGLESLMGKPIHDICHRDYEVAAPPPGTPRHQRVTDTDEVRKVASRFTFLAPPPPEPWDEE